MELQYPELADALYRSANLEEAWISYSQKLRQTQDLYHSQYAAKLEQSKLLVSTSNLQQLEQIYHAYRERLNRWVKKSGVQLTMLRRQKSFLGLNAKIRLYLQTQKALSQMHDLIGFRIVLQTPFPDSTQSIIYCYEILNETIRFFALNRNCILLDAEPRIGSKITTKKAAESNILIPQKSLVLPGFENNVKDYISNPKDNGYQSLHILIETLSGLIFEVQIRTAAMDILAEQGDAIHSLHKAKKYEKVKIGNIDFSRINMPGFKQLRSGEIYDIIGLQNSIDPFNSLH